MKSRSITIILIVLMSLTSCTRVFLKLYGFNFIDEINDDITVKYSSKYNIPSNSSFILDEEYLINELDSMDTKQCSINPNDQLTQPLQIRVFIKNKLVALQTNCDCGGFPNLDWDKLGLFDNFPPALIHNNFDLTDVYLFSNEILNFRTFDTVALEYSDYSEYDNVIVVLWSVVMGKQSKRLISKVQKYALEYPHEEIQVIYVNTDYWGAARE